MPKVMIFDTAGSTYLCILKEGMQGAKEFYRISGEDQWLTVDRTDKTRSALYEDAGVPKTIVWSGPTVVVYTHGGLLYTSPSPRDATLSRMPSSA